VCGTSTFQQNNVPICSSADLYVPGCTGSGNALYQNKNPFWYKFTCYTSGTLGFVITPNNLGDDYDWQLYDITGLNPDQVYTNTNIIVSGNWSGSSGTTGASATGVDFIQCASAAADNAPRFAKMPLLIAGREYILLVSHYTDSQSGYALAFGGGTAIITDPKEPHLQSAIAGCDGRTITVKLNKKMKCSSLSANGSEFSILPASAAVITSVAASCTSGFDFDEITITLNNPLPTGNYQLVIGNGSDGNTLLDNCDRTIPVNEQVPFAYTIPQPTPIDSIGTIDCAPDKIKVYFPKKINCTSIAANGSDFAITGPAGVIVTGASGECTNNLTSVITLQLSAPVVVGGTYTLSIRPGSDGNSVIDACGLETLPQTRTFVAVDTVSADFTYTTQLACRFNTLSFSHDGAHNVNSWLWNFNGTTSIRTRDHTIVFPASSSNTVQLIVSNGICSDTISKTVVMDNEVKAAFEMPAAICPEDALEVINTSTGLIDSWQWTFGNISNSSLKDPQPVLFPGTNIETNYSIKLVAINNTLNCRDSISKIVKVVNNCFIAVPTAFTPNNDGLNDFLFPNNAIKAENLDFKVFNRWGQMVFYSKEWTKKWDGKINGIPQAPGVFVWMLEYTHRDTKQKVFQKGTTTLIR
jgi:gliding motility-associated-like protein